MRLPDSAVVIKLGTQETRDDYDAFGPTARVSVAPPGMHDVQPFAHSSLGPTSDTLTTELAKSGARRIFLTGLATDYVVKRTAYTALASSQNWTVALLSAATRGIVPSATAGVTQHVAAAANGHRRRPLRGVGGPRPR